MTQLVALKIKRMISLEIGVMLLSTTTDAIYFIIHGVPTMPSKNLQRDTNVILQKRISL